MTLNKSQKEIEEAFLSRMRNKLIYCHRCNFVWAPKNLKNLPKNCPNCNSNYWNKPRRKEIEEFLLSTDYPPKPKVRR